MQFDRDTFTVFLSPVSLHSSQWLKWSSFSFHCDSKQACFLKCPTLLMGLVRVAACAAWKPVFSFFGSCWCRAPFSMKTYGCSQVIKRHLLLNRHLSVRLACADGAGGVLSRHNGGGRNYFCFPWDSSSAKLQLLFCVGLKKLHPAVQFSLAGRPKWRRDMYVSV